MSVQQSEVVFGGMTHERLSEVFDLVKPVGNWKEEISTTVFKSQATSAEIDAAIIFFTGGAPDILDEGESYWVRARGYYAEVGS